MKEGDDRFVALSWGDRQPPHDLRRRLRRLVWTAHHWQHWLARGRLPRPPVASYLQRSALTLKGLTFAPTGALIAAPTTSLPETPGGERNWDYRYTWIRDSTFTLWALDTLGSTGRPTTSSRSSPTSPAASDDAADHVRHRRRAGPHRSTLDHLHGYEGARPVRIGNGAFDQRAARRVGGVLDSVYLHTVARPDRRPALADPRPPGRSGDRALAEPDRGIWEVRGEPQHFTLSKVMCWVAPIAAPSSPGSAMTPTRDALAVDRGRRDPARHLANGVDERGVFVQDYGETALDASNLLIPLLRFLPPDDERVRATVLAIADELTVDGLVLRYRTEQTDDGLSGEEGRSRSAPSGWCPPCARSARSSARAGCARSCSRMPARSGLYAEELDPATGRHLGNFPQAFTHLALINAVMHVIASERVTEQPSTPGVTVHAGRAKGSAAEARERAGSLDPHPDGTS